MTSVDRCGRCDRSTPSTPSPGAGGPARSVTLSACGSPGCWMTRRERLCSVRKRLAVRRGGVGSSRKLGVVVWAWSTIAHPVAPRVTTETGKIPRSSRSTCTSRSSSSRVTAAAKSRRLGVEGGDRLSSSRCSPSSSSTSSRNSPEPRRARKMPSSSRARAAGGGRRDRSGAPSHRRGRRTATPVVRRAPRRRGRCARPSARGSRRLLGIRSGRTRQPTRSQPRRGRWLPSWASSRLR